MTAARRRNVARHIVGALAARGEPAIAERAVVRYQEQLERALAGVEGANAEGVDAGRLSATASLATLKNQAMLTDVYQRVPETAHGPGPSVNPKTRTGRPSFSGNLTAG